jgi:opacity protein-like surface antigen
MNRLSKRFCILAASFAMTGTALADGDPPAGGGGGDAAGGAAAGGAADPTAMPPPGVEPTTGGKGSKTIGADVIGVLPLGDYSKSSSFAIGAAGRFEYGVNDLINVTARIGYLHHLGTPSGFSLGIIPILVGGTYKIGTSGLFADAEIGLSIIRVSVDIGGTSASDSQTKFGFQVGAGYQTGKIVARAGFYMPGMLDNGGGGGSTTLFGLMGSVGYNFAAM